MGSRAAATNAEGQRRCERRETLFVRVTPHALRHTYATRSTNRAYRRETGWTFSAHCNLAMTYCRHRGLRGIYCQP
jgi:integrase